MRNLLKFAALATLLLPLACTDKNDPQKGSGETLPPSTLTEPAQAEHACVITIAHKEEVPVVDLGPDGDGNILTGRLNKWINAPSGRYIAEFDKVNAQAVEHSKAAVDIIRLTGTFTYKGGEYICDGGFKGKIKFEDNKLTVAPDGDAPVTVDATQQKIEPKNETESNACRTWSITKIELNLDSPAINHPFPDGTYKANSPKDIATYLKNHNVNVDPSKFDGYDIKEITLYPSINQVQVDFSAKDSYFGTFSLTGNTLNYNLSDFIKGDLFSGTASCTLTFTGNNCIAQVTVKTNSLSGSATITLTQKN